MLPPLWVIVVVLGGFLLLAGLVIAVPTWLIGWLLVKPTSIRPMALIGALWGGLLVAGYASWQLYQSIQHPQYPVWPPTTGEFILGILIALVLGVGLGAVVGLGVGVWRCRRARR